MTTSPSKHAPLPPSAAHRWMACPGSYRLTQGLPDTDSPDSRLGTFAHAIAADALHTGRPIETYLGCEGWPRDARYVVFGDADDAFACDQEMVGHLRVYVNAVRRCAMLCDGVIQVEQAVAWSSRVYGTADAVVHAHDGTGRIYLFDLKYGAGHAVDVLNNRQLLTYAAGLVEPMHLPPGLVEPMHIPPVTLVIVQPRRPIGDDEGLRSWEVPAAVLHDHIQQMVAAQYAVLQADAALVPGDHCLFCKGAATCPALHAQANEIAREVFPVADAPAVQPPPVETLSTAGISRVLAGAELVETWLAAVRKHAADVIARGGSVPGWKLVEKIGNRRWTDAAAAEQLLRANNVDPWVRTLVSPAQAEKALGKGGKSAVAPLTTRPVTGAALVPDSDPRPALGAGATQVFLDSPIE